MTVTEFNWRRKHDLHMARTRQTADAYKAAAEASDTPSEGEPERILPDRRTFPERSSSSYPNKFDRQLRTKSERRHHEVYDRPSVPPQRSRSEERKPAAASSSRAGSTGSTHRTKVRRTEKKIDADADVEMGNATESFASQGILPDKSKACAKSRPALAIRIFRSHPRSLRS